MILAYKTKRLIVRPLRRSDWQEWRKGYLERLPKQNVHDYGPAKLQEVSKAVFLKKIRKNEDLCKADKRYSMGIFDKGGHHVGYIDVQIVPRVKLRTGRIGYSIHSQFWHKGYASEAAKALPPLAFTKLRLKRVEAAINPSNGASIGVARKIGMKKEGLRKRRENGKWISEFIFTIF